MFCPVCGHWQQTGSACDNGELDATGGTQCHMCGACVPDDEWLAELPAARTPTVRHLHRCPACGGDGKLDVPAWRADVESWERERVPCPVCRGSGALDRDQWAARVVELRR